MICLKFENGGICENTNNWSFLNFLNNWLLRSNFFFYFNLTNNFFNLSIAFLIYIITIIFFINNLIFLFIWLLLISFVEKSKFMTFDLLDKSFLFARFNRLLNLFLRAHFLFYSRFIRFNIKLNFLRGFWKFLFHFI